MGHFASIPWRPIKGHSYAHVMGNIKNYEKAFAARYEAAYMWFLIQHIEKEIEGKNFDNKWQLSQRNWVSYEKPLKEGNLFVLSKKGGSKWKKRFCVLQPDYSLEIFKSKENYENGLKPSFKTKYSGFFVTGDVDGHLHEKLTIAARDFGYVNPNINAFAKRVTLIGLAGQRPTQHVFLVDHPWRGVTYFATETAIEKDQWLKVFQDSIRHLDGCQCDDEIGREAFAFAVEQSVRLQEFYVDRSMLSGTQEEILTDLISAFQSVDCKEVLVPRMTGGIVNKYKAWNFVLSSIHEIIHGIVTKQYLTWKEVWEENCHSKRQQIIDNLPQINKAYENTASLIRETLSECFDPILEETVLPRLPEVINIMSDSLVSPLRSTRQLFITLVESVYKEATNSSDFSCRVDMYFANILDFAPRNPEFTFPAGEMSGRGSASVAFLKNVFPNTDFKLHLKNVYTYQQQLLDSAVCTFETLCKESINNNDGKLSTDTISKIERRVLKKLDYDVLLAQKRFFRVILLSSAMESARESIEQCCKPKMLEFEAAIPADLRCYLPVNNVFTDVLTKRFGELINPTLTSCMRHIGKDTLSPYLRQLSDSRGSLSSFATIDSEDELSKLHGDGDALPKLDLKKNNSLKIKPEDSGSVSDDPTPDLSNPPEDFCPSNDPQYDVDVTTYGELNGENGECYGEMDGETGEWFPPASSSIEKQEGSDCKVDPAESSDSDCCDDNDEFSDRAAKRVAKELLDFYKDGDGIDHEKLPLDPIENKPSCSLVFACDDALPGMENGKHDSDHTANGYGPARYCGEAPNGYNKQNSSTFTNHVLKT